MNFKELAIMLAVVVVGVIVASMVSKKLGLNSYEEYEA